MTYSEIQALTTYPEAPTIDTLIIVVGETLTERQERLEAVLAAGLIAYKLKMSLKTHEGIDLLTTTFPNADTIDTFDTIEGETSEERQARYDLYFSTNLETYKNHLHTQLDLWVAEQAVIEAARLKKEAYDVVDAKFLVHYQADCGMPWRFGVLNDPNPIKAFRDIARDNPAQAETLLVSLKAAKASYDSALATKTTKESKRKIGEIVRRKCDDAYNHIIGHNLSAGLTIEQIDQLETDFAQILKAFINKRPDKAKALINNVTDPSYATLKAELLEIL
jgi:hypothetical protein